MKKLIHAVIILIVLLISCDAEKSFEPSSELAGTTWSGFFTDERSLDPEGKRVWQPFAMEFQKDGYFILHEVSGMSTGVWNKQNEIVTVQRISGQLLTLKIGNEGLKFIGQSGEALWLARDFEKYDSKRTGKIIGSRWIENSSGFRFSIASAERINGPSAGAFSLLGLHDNILKWRSGLPYFAVIRADDRMYGIMGSNGSFLKTWQADRH